MLFTFFFFQAEDGIRDIGVTGVQTCALPIYHCLPDVVGRRRLRVNAREGSDAILQVGRPPIDPVRHPFATDHHGRRSEERRVGKECRSRWSSDDYKKKELCTEEVARTHIKE